jgi:hypothetical protein
MATPETDMQMDFSVEKWCIWCPLNEEAYFTFIKYFQINVEVTAAAHNVTPG